MVVDPVLALTMKSAGLLGASIQIGIFSAIMFANHTGRGVKVIGLQLLAALLVILSIAVEFNLAALLLQTTRVLTCVVLLGLAFWAYQNPHRRERDQRP